MASPSSGTKRALPVDEEVSIQNPSPKYSRADVEVKCMALWGEPGAMIDVKTTDSAGIIAPTSPQLMQVPAELSNTNASSNASSGYASNIDDNSTALKSLPAKKLEPSDTCMKDFKNKQQQMQIASNAAPFPNNLFGNFLPSGIEAGGNPVQVVIQNISLTIPQIGPSSLPNPIIDHSKITHNSLEPFAQDICSSVDIQTILPQLITRGLLARHDKEYFIDTNQSSQAKQQKLMCLVVSLNENFVEKFLECLSETSDYAPHGELLEKIRNTQPPNSSLNVTNHDEITDHHGDTDHHNSVAMSADVEQRRDSSDMKSSTKAISYARSSTSTTTTTTTQTAGRQHFTRSLIPHTTIQSGNKLTKFEDILYNCNQATDDIEEMLSNHPTDTSRIISKLENISAVTNMEIPFFDKSIFKDVTATKELWQTLSQHMPIFNYPILKEFLNIVDFKEAKQVYDNFWSRIEDREMEDVKISNYCDHCKPKMFLLLRVKVKTEAMTNLLRKNIEDVLSNKFELKFFWLINIQSVENHSVLEYYLSGALKEHLLKEFEITTIDLHNFSNNKILSIQVDDQEQKTQLSEVHPWQPVKSNSSYHQLPYYKSNTSTEFLKAQGHIAEILETKCKDKLQQCVQFCCIEEGYAETTNCSNFHDLFKVLYNKKAWSWKPGCYSVLCRILDICKSDEAKEKLNDYETYYFNLIVTM